MCWELFPHRNWEAAGSISTQQKEPSTWGERRRPWGWWIPSYTNSAQGWCSAYIYFSALLYRRYIDKLETLLKRAIKMMEWTQSLSWVVRLSEMDLCRVEQQWQTGDRRVTGYKWLKVTAWYPSQGLVHFRSETQIPEGCDSVIAVSKGAKTIPKKSPKWDNP